MRNNENTNEKHFLQILREAIDKQIENIENEKRIEDQTNNISFDTEDRYKMEKEALNDTSLYWNILTSEVGSHGDDVEDKERIDLMKEEGIYKLEQKKRVHDGLQMEEYYPDLDIKARIRTLQQNLSNENGANKTFDLESASEETLRQQIGSQGGI